MACISPIVKDNYYLGEGPFTLTRLDANLEVQWRFPNPNGVEWDINAPAADRNGTVLAASEDGHLYAIDRRERERDRVFDAQPRARLARPCATAMTGVARSSEDVSQIVEPGRVQFETTHERERRA